MIQDLEYHSRISVGNKISTVAHFLLDFSGLLPIPGHVIDVSPRRRRGRSVRRFGAKETQPMIVFITGCADCQTVE